MRTQTNPRQAVPRVLVTHAAEGFVAPAGPNKEAMISRWVHPHAALVVAADGTALRVLGLRKKAQKDEWFLTLGPAGESFAAHKRTVEEIAITDASAFQHVIMGFFGGHLVTKQGIKVVVNEGIVESTSIVKVLVETFGPGDISLGETIHSLPAFLQLLQLAEYSPAPNDQAGPTPGDSTGSTNRSLAAFPALAAVMQAAYGNEPRDGALDQVLAGITGEVVGSAEQFAEHASALEAKASTPAARVAVQQLQSAREAHLLPAGSQLGDVIRRLVFPPAATAIVAAPAPAPRAQTRAPGGGASRPGDGSDPDDSESEIDDDPGDAPGAGPGGAAKRKRGPSDTSHSSRTSRAGRTLGDPAAAKPKACLEFLTPPGVEVLFAARVFFEADHLREVAGCAHVPPEIQPADEMRMQARYGLAARAVLSRAPRGWVEARAAPDSLDDLAVFSEELASELKHATVPQAPTVTAPVLEKEGKPAEALAPAAREHAVSPDVAMRLHTNAAAIPLAEEGFAVAAAPEHLRLDLERAVRSNGKVDAAGETAPHRKSLPARVHSMRSACEQRVEAALAEVAVSDVSGQAAFPSGATLELAARIIRGDITLDPFEDAARKAFAHLKLKAGSEESLSRGIALLETGVLALFAFMSDRQAAAAVAALKHGLQPGGAGAMLAVDVRKQWANKVFSHYGTALARFRRFRAPKPDLADSIAACRQGLNFSVFAQLLQQPNGDKPPVDEPTDRKPKPGGKKEPQPKPAGKGGKAKEKVNCVPNRPDFPDDKFQELKSALHEAHPGICGYYCLSRNGCNRAKCSLKHEAPPSFKEFVASRAGKK